MGRHKEIGSGGGGGGNPKPKKGKERNSCRQVAKIELEKSWSEEEKKRWEKETGKPWQDALKVGTEITVFSSEDFYGEEQYVSSDPLRQPRTPEQLASFPAIPVRTSQFDPNNPRIYVQRDTYEIESNELTYQTKAAGVNGVDKTKESQSQGARGELKGGFQGTKVFEDEKNDPDPVEKVRGSNKKKEVLKKKKNDKIENPELAGVQYSDVPFSTAVENIVQEAGFNNYVIDGVDGFMPSVVEFNEMMIQDCIDMIAKMAGANWTVTADGTFHFFTPDSRPSEIVATTDPFGVRDYIDSPVNPIQRKTLKITTSSEEQTNRVQIMNAGERSKPYTEIFVVPPTPVGQHEFHTSYMPDTVEGFYEGDEIGFSIPVEQDWGDRTYLPTAPIAGTTGYYPSPKYYDVPSGNLVAKLNKDEKIFRIFDKITGEPTFLPTGTRLTMTYTHIDPVYLVVEDAQSIAAYGKKEIMMISPDQHRIEEMQTLAEAEVRDFSEPIQNIECRVFNDVYSVGDSVRFIAPELGIDQRFCVYEVERPFDINNREVGQAVVIRAGSKIPIKVEEVIKNINKRTSGLERAYNLTDFGVVDDPSHKFSVPYRVEQYQRERFGLKDQLTITVETLPFDRIDSARIDSDKIT